MRTEKRKLIRDFTDNSEIVGYWRNHGYNCPITVGEVKGYFPHSEHHNTMHSAVMLIKELNETVSTF